MAAIPFSVELSINQTCRIPAGAVLLCMILLAGMLVVGASPVHARLILFSTSGSADLGGLSFDNEDLILFDPATNTASLFFDGSLYKKDEDTNAVSVLENGNLLLSTRTNAILGGLSFEDGDIVEYNPLTDSASLYFSEELFTGNEEISALSLLDNGNLVLSTRGTASLGGLEFEDQDLVEYDFATGQVSLFLDGGRFSRNQNISAVHVLTNGNVALSTRKKATLGGVTFGDDSIIEYDPTTDTASLIFDGSSWFSNGYEDIDALFIFEAGRPLNRVAVASSLAPHITSVSEPDSLALLGACIFSLLLMRQNGDRMFRFGPRAQEISAWPRFSVSPRGPEQEVGR
ncbi:MAG: hypothetical protein AAF749_09605 [Pseudomonadota bacterium]